MKRSVSGNAGRVRPSSARPEPPDAQDVRDLTQELQSQLDALSAHGIPRDKIFSEKVSSRVRVRPQFEAALTVAREIKAHAPHCRVLFTVYEMKRLGRDAAELTARSTRPGRRPRPAARRRGAGATPSPRAAPDRG
ncbi:recombinase family protein [Kitasatospora sp. NPDC001603]|uniref:recombinase family protein n=1 Tax=Kitasatospora sp. NPDC001603 TaxID=3154388 RepID=UPI00332B8697